MEFTKDEKNALEWLFIKGMEITNSDKKHQIFDVMHKRLVNNLPIPSVVKSLPNDEEVKAYIDTLPYYGTCTTEYNEGFEDGIKWLKGQMSK